MGCADTTNLKFSYYCIAFVLCKQLLLGMCVCCVLCIFAIQMKWINVVHIMFSLL